MELKAGVIRTPHNEGIAFDRDSSRIAVTEDETEFYIKSEVDKFIRHQKYKRCLNMSNWCSIRSNLFFVVGRNEGVRFAKEKFRRSDLYSKWCLRWFKIAEQFKEAK